MLALRDPRRVVKAELATCTELSAVVEDSGERERLVHQILIPAAVWLHRNPASSDQSSCSRRWVIPQHDIHITCYTIEIMQAPYFTRVVWSRFFSGIQLETANPEAAPAIQHARL